MPIPPDNFAKNLNHLLLVSGEPTHEAFARRVNLSRTVLSRLLNGSRDPSRRHIWQIARAFGMRETELLLAHDKFKKLADDYSVSSNLPLLSFRTIAKNLEKLNATFETYKGQYTIYSGKKDGTTVASLLTIDKHSQEGVHFTFINPYRDQQGSTAAFVYDGFMFAAHDYLYLFGEQQSQDYEILSIIIHASALPRVGVLMGLMCGIGVLDDSRYIAAAPIVAIRRQRPISDWRKALGSDLGYLPEQRIPEVVRRRLSGERIVVSA